MDEDETNETVEIHPLKHSGWSVLVLGASWAAGVAAITAESFHNFSVMAAQHNLHKREQDKFYEVVKNG
jgi:hypothetical protein